MADDDGYDVFLSHSSRDKEVVRDIAERLRRDGLKVWFDEWELQPGDSIPAKIDRGLERSRVLVLCMSAQAFGSEWARLESYTFRFKDPLNQERRFIPLRLDDTELKASLAQFLYIDWRLGDRTESYRRLREACARPRHAEPPPELRAVYGVQRSIGLGHVGPVRSLALSPNAQLALSASSDKTLRLWDVASGRSLRVFEGHSGSVGSVVFSSDGSRALSGSDDTTLRLWDVERGHLLRVFEGHSESVWSVAFSNDGRRALSGSYDKTLRLWDVDSGRQLRILEGHSGSVFSVAFSADGRRALSGSYDKTVRVWDVDSGGTLRVLKGHSESVGTVAFSSDGRRALSGSDDNTLCVWDVGGGRLLREFKGHSRGVGSVAFSTDGQRALSGSHDNTIRSWDVDSGKPLRSFKARGLGSVAFSSDGHYAFSSSNELTLSLWEVNSGRSLRVFEGHAGIIAGAAFSSDGRRALTGSSDNTLRLWDVNSGRSLCVLKGHSHSIWNVALRSDGRRALAGAHDGTVGLWDVDSGRLLRVFDARSNGCVAFGNDGRLALSSAEDFTLRLWDVDSGRVLRVFEGHSSDLACVAFTSDGRRALSGSNDKTLRLWDLESGRSLRVLKGHSGHVWSVAISSDGSRALSGSDDNTLRLWDLESGRSLRVFEGHSGAISTVAFSGSGRRALSGSHDATVRLWDVDSGRALRVFEGHSDKVRSVVFSSGGRGALSAAENGVIHVWDLQIAEQPPTDKFGDAMSIGGVQYANAKVLLVGDSGVGKSGLAGYLAHNRGVEDDKPLTSTDGAWATHWLIPHSRAATGVDHEIWLWDFAGQVDYRLVHQLFMDETAAAVLVFNPQSENPFEGIGHWEKDLQKASRAPFAKLLAAGRVDRGGLVVSSESIARFMKERGFREPLHLTSAKTGEGCDALRDAIVAAIDWERIPITTSVALYQRIKQEILELRDQGTALIRLDALNQRLELRLGDMRFSHHELQTAISHLAGPGMIQRLDFGGFILLRPEVLSRYASALVRRVRRHPQELGCILEASLLEGDLDYQDFERLPRSDEEVVLRALLETVVSRGWCLRQSTDKGSLLTFPSLFRRERREAPSHPNVLVHYRFAGPVDEVYATLVVRLHHTQAFDKKELWKDSADFQTQTGATLGLQLLREGEGFHRLEAYFEPDVDENARVIFLRYVHEHLQAHGQEVVRLRNYFCANRKCKRYQHVFTDRPMIDEALAPGGSGKVFCPACGKAVSLRDNLEKRFESPTTRDRVRELQEQGEIKIDNESRELQAVHHLGFIVAEAGQIFRLTPGSDHGIDGEIEFKDDEGRATGRRLYVQVKSGDSHVRKRQRDGAEVFQMRNARWTQYWQQQAYPVMLVIRTSDGVIRWMDVSAHLREHTGTGETVRWIEFEGDVLDVLDVRRKRDLVLRGE